MRSWSFGLSISIASLAFLAADRVEAAPAVRRGEGIHQGGYIYGSPGIVAIPMDEDDFADLDPTWQWSFGGGYLWTPTRLFKVSLGGAFEHTILNFDSEPVGDNLDANMIRILPEVRIGAGTNRVWGYGLIGPGLGITVVDDDVLDDSEAAPGFIMQIGGGVQGVVWRSLFLGGELDFDLGFFEWDDDRFLFVDNDFEIHTMGLKFILGWYF